MAVQRRSRLQAKHCGGAAASTRLSVMERLLLPRPVVLYDGACGLCTSSMRRWQVRSRGVVSFSPYGEGVEACEIEMPEVPQSLILIEKNGDVRTGAEAIFRLMALCESPFGGVAWRMHEKIGIFRFLSALIYRHIAKRRHLLSRLLGFQMQPNQ